jgi:hypothetical protein
MDLAVWQRSLGLEQYEAAFRDNAVDDTVLPKLTAEDLKDLVSLPSVIAGSCLKPSRSYAQARAPHRLRQQLLRRVLHYPKTPLPNAAK